MQVGEHDLAWIIFGGLKAIGVEASDYPPVNAWMAKAVLQGMTSTSTPAHEHMVRLDQYADLHPHQSRLPGLLAAAASSAESVWQALHCKTVADLSNCQIAQECMERQVSITKLN